MTAPTKQRRVSDKEYRELRRAGAEAIAAFAAQHGITGDISLERDSFGGMVIGAPVEMIEDADPVSFTESVVEDETIPLPDLPDLNDRTLFPNKESIEQHALEHFGENLDTRMTRAAMIETVQEMHVLAARR